MMSERQLSILGPNGCIGNDLSHKLCIIKGPRRGFEAVGIFDVNMLKACFAVVAVI